MNEKLSSQWGELNKHLIAEFFEVVRIGNNWAPSPDSPIVRAPLSECGLDATANWQSPFENTDTDTKTPALAAMLQSGAAGSMMEMIGTRLEQLGILSKNVSNQRSQNNAFLTQFEGRSGMTRLNSTQVFTGMAPMKFTATAVFRAWKDPMLEVEVPFNQLMDWFLPEKLSDDGTAVIRGLSAVTGGGDGVVETIMPSLAPCKIGMKYKGRTYRPLVIEGLSQPLGSPVDSNGFYVEYSVQMTMGTLTALDRGDWHHTQWG